MSVSLADAIFWVAVACCSVAQIAILHSVVISPTSPARGDSRDVSATPTHRVGEIVWAVLPGVALVFVFVATWRVMHP